MDRSKGATARLRRTFRYPDDGADSQPEAMDEQEQESLIARLTAENTARNTQFRNILLALPLLTTLPYIPTLIQPQAALLSLLSLTSLLSTAFLLYRLPPTVTGIAPLDAWSRKEDVVSATRDAGRMLRRRGAGMSPAMVEAGRSPLEVYLPYLNLGLVFVLALRGLLGGEASAGFGWVGLGNLPALVFAVVLVAKIVMGSVDPEKELAALKYEYKGA